MAGLYGADSSLVNRLPKKWVSASTDLVNRELKEIWARDSGGVNRKIFSSKPSFTVQANVYDGYSSCELTASGQMYAHGTGSYAKNIDLFVTFDNAISVQKIVANTAWTSYNGNVNNVSFRALDASNSAIYSSTIHPSSATGIVTVTINSIVKKLELYIVDSTNTTDGDVYVLPTIYLTDGTVFDLKS